MLLVACVPRSTPNWPRGIEGEFYKRIDAKVLDEQRLMHFIRFHRKATHNPTHIEILKNAVFTGAVELFCELIAEKLGG